jgi:7-cyano-7-deazaguanine synthase in queuosine biosynthesis
MIHRVRTPTGERYVEINLPRKPYRAFVSGGFDSAVMLYLLCLKALDTKQDTVYTVVVDRGPEQGAVEFSKGVCEWASEKTGIKIDQLVMEVPEDIHHSLYVKVPGLHLNEQGYVCISADTQNPPDCGHFPGIAPNRIAPGSNYSNWRFPFGTLDKSHTVYLAWKLGILDEVSAITHTCTATPNIRCGECWQDTERAWAFDLLGLEDPGIY